MESTTGTGYDGSASKAVIETDFMWAPRERAARAYLLVWRPLVVISACATSTVIEILDSDTPELASMGVLWSSVLLVGAFAALALLGVNARRLAASMVLLDLPLLLVWAISSENPDPAFASYCGTIAITAWLLSARAAMGIGATAMSITIGYWILDGPWGDAAMPDVLWAIFGTTVLAGAISRDVERSSRRAADALRAAAEEAQRVTQIRRRLVADVSHELRTPLAAVSGFLDTLLRRDIKLDESMRNELTEQARRGSRRLEHLVSDLLDIERMAHGVLTLEVAQCSVMSLVADALDALPVPDGRHIETSIPDAVGGVLVDIDERRIVQVICNLVGNGLKHGSGTVSVIGAIVEERLRIDVSDDGPGLDPVVGEQAFEPFFSHGPGEGSAGLGLTISRHMAELHGGTLTYVDDAGDGRHAFRIELPVGCPLIITTA